MVAVTYDRQERIGDLLWSLSVGYEPGPLIELLASADLKSLVKQSQIVIAHDAKVIRPLCETLSPEFAAAPWSCSATEIPWASVGAGSFDLDNLLLRNNWLNSGQRPIDRCHAILELLAAPFVSPDTMALSMLLATARVKQIRFWVDNVQTNIRDVLELHGYRPIEGAAGSNQWWHDVPAAAEEAERAFLQQVYQSDYEPRTEDVTARTRFRAPTIR
jgi:DNA polymerase-3 subunit epsilon